MIQEIKVVEDLFIAQFDESLFSNSYVETDKYIRNAIKLLIEKNIRVLAIDMGNIYTIDSRGLVFMIKIHNKIAMYDMELIFYNLNSLVDDLVTLSTMDKVLYVMTKEIFEGNYLE